VEDEMKRKILMLEWQMKTGVVVFDEMTVVARGER